ncbi:Hypothetical predicted protein [Olea europaea subsp. europaea]|uniref:Uncharacterized protein n=1 Tax=Olea europaea subsp. europaea TaxID=158383 RepID=A0A8S0TEJ1_OLEEU|nr:Hypothetical predicted protein [Olea europaea subsp. europaea]
MGFSLDNTDTAIERMEVVLQAKDALESAYRGEGAVKSIWFLFISKNLMILSATFISYNLLRVHVVNISEEILKVKKDIKNEFSGVDPSWGHGESNFIEIGGGH